MIFIVLILAILVQVFLTVKKVSPFLSLLVVAIMTGLLRGMDQKALLTSFETGAGSTLGGLALIICLGAMLGKMMETSGAVSQITETIIRGFGQTNIQWGVLLTGFLIGIPLYYNAGFIILVPLIFSIARTTGLPLLYIALPMAASLSVTHCFLPPHPGPVTLVGAFNADMGKTLLYGLVLAIPAVIIAGPLLGKFYKKSFQYLEDFVSANLANVDTANRPPVWVSFFVAMLPVLLIALGALARIYLKDNNPVCNILMFTGDSTVALLISVLMAIYFFGIRTGKKIPEIMHALNEAVSGVAMILLIITAGGIFKQVLIDSGTGLYIATFSSNWNMHPLVFGWLITALLRVCIGSATVAGLTAAGIVAPLVQSGVSPELMVLAVGSGSVFGSHINDTGFWMYKEFFRLSLKQTFLSWTVMEVIISVAGLVGVLLLDIVL